MLIFTSYYFLSKTNEFTRNLKYSKVTEYGQAFDAIPLFNLIKSSDATLRDHANNTLLTMYERIPLKSELSLNDWNFKFPLLDGLSDANPNSREISYKIITRLEKDAPDVLDEAVGMVLESRLRNLLAKILAHRLEETGEAGRDKAVNLARAPTSSNRPRYKKNQQDARRDEHDDLITHDRNHALRRQRPAAQVNRDVPDRVLDNVIEWIGACQQV